MRWWMILLLVLLVLIVGARMLSARTTILQMTLIRLICAGNAGVKPKDYDAVLAKSDTLETDASY